MDSRRHPDRRSGMTCVSQPTRCTRYLICRNGGGRCSGQRRKEKLDGRTHWTPTVSQAVSLIFPFSSSFHLRNSPLTISISVPILQRRKLRFRKNLKHALYYTELINDEGRNKTSLCQNPDTMLFLVFQNRLSDHSWLFSLAATSLQKLFYFNSVDWKLTESSEHFTKITKHSRAVVMGAAEML